MDEVGENCLSIDLQNQISSVPPSSWDVQGLWKGGGDSVLLNVEFCPPPVASLGIVLLSERW